MTELPAGWAEASLGEFTTECTQRSPSGGELIHYVDISSIDREMKTIILPEPIPASRAPSRARKILKTGDVLVAMTRPNLNAVALVPASLEGQFASTGFDVLRPVIVEPRWIYYLVRTKRFVDAMTQRVQGALYPAIRAHDVRGFRGAVAPHAEQVRIVNKVDVLLGRVEACRRRLVAIRTVIERFRHSVLHAATTGGLTPRTHYRDWERVPLEGLLADPECLSYGVLKPDAQGADPVSMYRVVDIGPWGTRNETVPSVISRSLSNEYARTILEPGDILLSVMATIGRAMVATPEMAGANVNRAIAVIKHDRTRVDSRFLMFQLLAPKAVREFEQRSVGSAQVRINLSDLRRLVIAVPPLDVQEEAVRRADALFALAHGLESGRSAAAERVDALIPSVLERAFRGELLAQDPRDEPASTLLERVRAAMQASAGADSLGSPKAGEKEHRRMARKKRGPQQDIGQERFLAERLRELGGRGTAEQLFGVSGLSVPAFYKQLSLEVDKGHIVDRQQWLEVP